MALTNSKALVKETEVFVKKETTFGTLAFPAATDAIRVTAVPTGSQPESFTESEELQNSRSKPDRARDQTPAAPIDLKLYSRPSGAAGTPPQEDVLMECVLGKKTVNAGVSVVYEPAIALPSFSLCWKEGHTWFFAAGCKVGNLSWNFASKGYLSLGFGGMAKKVMLAGTSETVAGSTTQVLNLAAGGALLFMAGAYVQVGSDDNTGAGYVITAVDTAADTITISPALASPPAAEVVVKGFLPTPSWSGTKVEAGSGTVSLDGADLKIMSATGNLNNNLVQDDQELTSDQFVSDIEGGARDAGGQLSCRFRREYAGFFSRARNQIQGAIILQAGASAGSRVKFELPQAEMNTPSLGGDNVWRELNLEVVGLPTAANEDEAKVTYF
ncbi:MAG: hypothetical protein K9K36_16570 [Desulfarculaceae bacterium]|nr:hypothetical protein [Desulfarculaceae bacterium]MCF8066863.1 hypothetical protein [Desulfarculaceae bacterium]MCF8124511.1 hypothetical protein [Desulfarculaceae bacterium]